VVNPGAQRVRARLTALWAFVPAVNPYRFPHPGLFIAIAALFASAVAVQLYWFYRVRTPIQRQQTKWVVYPITASVAGDFLTHLPWQIFHLEHGQDFVVLLVHQPFFVAFQVVVPLAIAFSVLRYQLWEIDFVVSRTLLYGSVAMGTAFLSEALNVAAASLIDKMMGRQARAHLPAARRRLERCRATSRRQDARSRRAPA